MESQITEVKLEGNKLHNEIKRLNDLREKDAEYLHHLNQEKEKIRAEIKEWKEKIEYYKQAC